MKLVDSSGKEMMVVSQISADERNFLVVKGKVFGAMPMTAKLSPEEARAALKMLDWRTVWFLLTMLLRKSRPARKTG